MTSKNLPGDTPLSGADVKILRASEKLLRTIVYRLTLLSTDEDQPFINRLEALRTSLQDGVPTLKLKPLLDEISAHIQSLENQKKDKGSREAVSREYSLRLLSPMLLKMIEGVKYPSALRDRLEPVKALLRNDASLNSSHNVARSLEAYFEILADFYDTIVCEEQAKMQGYLHKVTRELLDIDRHMQETESLQLVSSRACTDIDKAVNSEVKQLEDSVGEDLAIDDLKSCIQDRLSAIRACMRNFRTQEDERHQQSSRLIGELNERLYKMEKEADHLRDAIEEKHRQYLSDSLTGIPNRKAYEERIQQACERHCRYATPVNLIMCDVDNFKNINDRYGHAAGDKVLKTIAKVLQKNIRTVDFVARYGGEEFTIIMPDTALGDGVRAAEKLRQAVERHEVMAGGRLIPVTISGGIAQLRKDDSPASLFERADNALYVAKESGRNRFETE